MSTCFRLFLSWLRFVKLDPYHMIQLQADFFYLYPVLEGEADEGFESLCLSAYPSVVGIVVFVVVLLH